MDSLKCIQYLGSWRDENRERRVRTLSVRTYGCCIIIPLAAPFRAAFHSQCARIRAIGNQSAERSCMYTELAYTDLTLWHCAISRWRVSFDNEIRNGNTIFCRIAYHLEATVWGSGSDIKRGVTSLTHELMTKISMQIFLISMITSTVLLLHYLQSLHYASSI